MYKSQLQEYVQKAALPLPAYESAKEGAAHQPRFRAAVTVDGVRFESDSGHTTLKAAEHAAAKIALAELMKSGSGKNGVTPALVVRFERIMLLAGKCLYEFCLIRMADVFVVSNHGATALCSNTLAVLTLVIRAPICSTSLGFARTCYRSTRRSRAWYCPCIGRSGLVTTTHLRLRPLWILVVRGTVGTPREVRKTPRSRQLEPRFLPFINKQVIVFWFW